MDDKLKSTLIEARARIIWGSSLHEVAEWLQSQGLDREQIDTVVQICREERAAEIRKLGLRDLAIGGLILLPSIVALAIMPLVWPRPGAAITPGVTRSLRCLAIVQRTRTPYLRRRCSRLVG